MFNTSRHLILSISVVVAIGTAAFALTVRHARNADFRRAAAWHGMYGSTLMVEGHKLQLPHDWWGEEVEGHSTPRVFKATREISHASQTVIDFSEKGINERKRSGQEIRQTLELLVVHGRKYGNEFPQESQVEVTAVSTKMYCLKTLLTKEELGLRCNVVDGTIVINSAGPPDTEGEILAILSSFD